MAFSHMEISLLLRYRREEIIYIQPMANTSSHYFDLLAGGTSTFGRTPFNLLYPGHRINDIRKTFLNWRDDFLLSVDGLRRRNEAGVLGCQTIKNRSSRKLIWLKAQSSHTLCAIETARRPLIFVR
jgi:hypothetical protein